MSCAITSRCAAVTVFNKKIHILQFPRRAVFVDTSNDSIWQSQLVESWWLTKFYLSLDINCAEVVSYAPKVMYGEATEVLVNTRTCL
jgi:hypothetical protein